MVTTLGVVLMSFFLNGDSVSGNGTWWTIVTALAGAVVALCLFIKKLIKDVNECKDDRIKSLEEKLSMIRNARRDVSP